MDDRPRPLKCDACIESHGFRWCTRHTDLQIHAAEYCDGPYTIEDEQKEISELRNEIERRILLFGKCLSR